ncbi:hypothetical protein LEP3755_46860 [Leptolyngbya sp. NIES-3755]|nr:hypothetical protein LEP3755_46860 [Leptolyngbya sp. NIES-3755]
MPTQKFKPNESVAYAKTPVQVKVLPGVRERLKTVPNWQDKLRRLIDQLIQEELGG